jgi:thymidylate synthase (FAD)
MKLIRPSVVIESNVDESVLQSIEKIGRVCYKSEDKITKDSSEQFIKNIIKRGHESVIEHYNVSVRFIVDRGVTHELVRHRLCSFSQESTRYVNYQGREIEFVLPCWFNSITEEGVYGTSEAFAFEELGNKTITGPRKDVNYSNFKHFDKNEVYWMFSMLQSEETYNQLIKNGWTPQQARSVLPNSLKTEIVTTCNLREWRHILKLRTSKAAHPQMREIMLILSGEIRRKIPIIFDDI